MQADGPEDAVLLARFVQQGDEEAFGRLVDRHGGVVLGVCRRLLRDPHLAEDAFQQTLLALARHAAAIDCQDTLVRWLHTTAWRKAKDLALKAHRQRERPVEQAIMDERFEHETTTDPAEDLRGIIDEELAALPERQRSMLLLRHVEGHTRADCARLLGISIGSTSDLLDRAGEALRRRLLRRGITVGTTLLVASLQQAAAEVPPALARQVVAQACAHRALDLAAIPTSAAKTASSSLSVGALAAIAGVAIAGLVTLTITAWTAIAAPGDGTVPPPTIDPYDPAHWQVDDGLGIAFDHLNLADEGQTRVIRLGPGSAAAGKAQLRVDPYLPDSFRFSYQYLHADSRAKIDRLAHGDWIERALVYRLRPDASGYDITEEHAGRRQTTQDSLAFDRDDPFSFRLGNGTWLQLKNVELDWLPTDRPD